MACKKQQREAKEIAEKFLDESWTVVIRGSYITLCLSQALWHRILTKAPRSGLWLFPFCRGRSWRSERLRSLPKGPFLINSGVGFWIQVHLTLALLWTIYWLVPEITMAANHVSATLLRTLLTHFVPTITIRGVCITFIPTYGWINGRGAFK